MNKTIKSIESKVKKAIFDYGLINDGDHILIAVSGGKDSLALVEFLGRRKQIFKPRFTLIAAHIGMENIGYGVDIAYLNSFCAQYNIPFIHEITRFNAETDRRKSPCFLCSWYRRKALFELAKSHGCNKIALGHHQDDILQTLLLNMTHQGAISTMPPLLKMDKFEMTLIRPLALVPESLLKTVAQEQGYKLPIKNCPYECSSSRPESKEVIRLLEQINPQVRNNLWASMSNIQNGYLPQKIKTKS